MRGHAGDRSGFQGCSRNLIGRIQAIGSRSAHPLYPTLAEYGKRSACTDECAAGYATGE